MKSLTIKVFSWATQRLSSYWFSRLLQISQQWKLFTMRKDIGFNTYIDKTVQVNGWQSISIGHSSVISEDAWLNVNVRKKGIKHIEIGNNCYIGKRIVLSSAHQILVGDYCMAVQDCKFLGSDHIFNDPLSPYLTTGTTSEGVIKLESNVWLGAGVIIVGNVTIGRGSVIGAGSIVTSDILPFSIAVGVPCRIIKRYDFKDSKWVDIKDYCIDMDQMMPGESEYLDILKKKYPKVCFPLQGASRAFGHMG
jgi:acetyltransferase-like isoleucine patch superfamily enzyme